MSNKDVQVSGSQAAAQSAFAAELADLAAKGQVDTQQYWQKLIGQNTSNHLYKNN